MPNFSNIIANIQSFNLIEWVGIHGLRIVFIIIGAVIVHRILKTIIRRTIKAVTYSREDAVEKRNETLAGVLIATLKIVISIFAILLILTEFGINIGPLLAGAGIVGLAIGFGAQNLVKDAISGLFILLEDQYRKGDVVKIAGITGSVEEVNLRKTVLRDLDGTEHHIPNGEINIASNLTKNWSRLNLDIPVAYDTDIDHAIEVINRVGLSLAEDAVFNKMIIKPPQVLGVEDFEEKTIKLKVLGDTKPLKQWDVTREFRKRIKQAFDKEGIAFH